MNEQEKREYLRRLVRNSEPDNLERAEAAFGHADLSQQHGQSGQTRGQILEGYRDERRQWQEAYDYLQTLIGPEAFLGRHVKPGFGRCRQCGGDTNSCTGSAS